MTDSELLYYILFALSCLLGERLGHAFNFWKW